MKNATALLLLGILFGFTGTVDANPVPVIKTRLVESHPIQMPVLKEYPVYINAFLEDEPGVEIDRVEVSVDGNMLEVMQGTGYYYVLWRPEAYQSYTLNMTAFATNEQSSSISRTVSVVSSASDQIVRTLDEVVIEFGGTNSRWYSGFYELPQHVGSYRQIVADLKIECPSVAGGCDDWDRVAWIEIKGPDDNWIELIRYITPYGVGCDHSYDVSQFESLLQGKVEFRMFIDTWGTGGWKITLDLDHTEGSPLYLYSRVDEIWDGGFDFGNPTNLQPVPVVNYKVPVNAVRSKLWLVNTGHGWGENNSLNAAEFYHAIHSLKVNGGLKDSHDLWWQCNPNPDNCTGQQGSWTFNRAGWCPGAIASADVFNYGAYIGQPAFDMSYIFEESYVDNCHPNSLTCISGNTCPDCNDGFNPIYYVDAVMVTQAQVPLLSDDYVAPPPLPTGIRNDYSNLYQVNAYPNPSNGVFKLSVSDNLKEAAKVIIYTIDSASQKVYYFNSPSELAAYEFDLSNMPAGYYFVNVQAKSGEGVLKIMIE